MDGLHLVDDLISEDAARNVSNELVNLQILARCSVAGCGRRGKGSAMAWLAAPWVAPVLERARPAPHR